MIERTALVGVLVGLLGLLGGCDRDQPKEHGSSGSAETTRADYSSFGVRLQSQRFRLISFKDVGLDRANPKPSDPLLEAIARSVSRNLEHNRQLQVHPRVVYDESLADPSKHTFCQEERLYVDVWRSTNPSRWGYSLWSGCSSSQKFDSGEVTIPKNSDPQQVDEAVKPLGGQIAESLADAKSHGCFRRAC